MKMKYGRIPGVEKPVSRLILGNMGIYRPTVEESFAMLDAALRLGVNTFDMAHIYHGGGTERRMGEWLADRGCRDRVVLVSKGGHHNSDRPRVTPYDIESDLHDSLARLRAPSIDLYFLHRDNPDVPVGPIVETLDQLRRDGLISAYGGSNWTHARLQAANDHARQRGLAPFTASSPNFGLAEQVQDPWGPGCVTLSGPAQREARDWYSVNNMPVLAYSSLGRGLFSGRVDPNRPEEAASVLDQVAMTGYAHPVNFERLRRVTDYARACGRSVTQVALAWLLNQPLDVYALVGTQTPDELAQLMEALAIPMTQADLAHMNLE